MRKQKKLIFRFGIEPLTKLDESVLVIKVLFKGLLYEPQIDLRLAKGKSIRTGIRIPDVEEYEVLTDSSTKDYKKYFKIIKDEKHPSGMSVEMLGFALEIYPKMKNHRMTMYIPEKAKWINQKLGILIKIPFSLYWIYNLLYI